METSEVIKCPVCKERMMTLGQLNQHLDDFHFSDNDGRMQVSLTDSYGDNQLYQRNNAVKDGMGGGLVRTNRQNTLKPQLKQHQQLQPSSHRSTLSQESKLTGFLKKSFSSLNITSPADQKDSAPAVVETCQLCSKTLSSVGGIFIGGSNCRKCQRICCDSCCDYQCRLDASMDYDTMGDFFKVCRRCFEGREGYFDSNQERSRTKEFLKRRKRRVGPDAMESNKLLKRLDKIRSLHLYYKKGISNNDLEVYNSYGSLREAEKAIGQWEDDVHVIKCPFCKIHFGLISRRHHCRLCGKIVCGTCSFMKHLDSGDHVHNHNYIMPNSSTASFNSAGNSLASTVRSVSSVGSSDRNKIKIGEIRICSKCDVLVFKKPLFAKDIGHGAITSNLDPESPVVKLYEAVRRIREKIDIELPLYNQLLSQIESNDIEELKKDPEMQKVYIDAGLKRKEVISLFAELDMAGKRILSFCCSNEDGHSRDRERLGKNIYQNISTFLQDNMFTLQALPKLISSNDTSDAKPTTVDPVVVVLEEQKQQLMKSIEENKKARRFEDVKILQQNLSEIERELQKFQK